MTKKWIAINLLLLLAAGLLARQLKVSIADFKAENNVAKIQAAKKKTGPDARQQAYQPPPKFNDAQVSAIYSQNLFSESRKLEDPANTPQEPQTRTLTNPPILVGSLVTSSQKLGLIIDTTSPQSGSRRMQVVHIGDVYQGFTVSDITSDNMVLEYGASRNVIPLSDSSKPPQVGKTPILQTRVVNFGGGSAGGQGGALAGVIPSSTGSASRPGVSPNVTGARGTPQQVISMQQGAGGRGAAQAVQQQVTPQTMQQGNLYPNQYYNTQGQLVTQTPFGPMVTQQPPVKK